MNGRPYGSGNGPTPLPSSYAAQAQQDARDADHPRNHTRDLSGSRGRGPALPNIAISNMQAQQANSGISPRSQSSASNTRSPASLNGALERRPSAAQSHYRQPSRAHSNYPQSRNAIFVASPTTSPLSPETPGSASTNHSQPDFSNYTMVRRQASVRYPSDLPTTSNTKHTPSTSSSGALIGDRDVGDVSDTVSAQKRMDRAQPSRSRSGHHHHRSQSRHHHEQKSVGEYALHHLFNKVSLYTI